MKITSKDCVARVVKEVGGKAADWKRTNKRVVGAAIVREFTNKATQEIVEVVEEKGKLRVMADKPTLPAPQVTGNIVNPQEDLMNHLISILNPTEIVDFESHAHVKISGITRDVFTKKFFHYFEAAQHSSKFQTFLSDVSFVEVNGENTDAEGGYGNSQAICGFKTLSSGLTYFGFCAGGDWECPVFFLLYFDGKDIRGYIPTDGNPWNTDNNMAYGNDENSDSTNLTKRFGIPYDEDSLCEVDVDCPAILRDINKNTSRAGSSFTVTNPANTQRAQQPAGNQGMSQLNQSQLGNGQISAGLAKTLAQAMANGTKVIGVGPSGGQITLGANGGMTTSGNMTPLTPADLCGEGHTPKNDPARYATIEQAIKGLNEIVNIDSSAVKVLMENVKVPCVAEMEDVKGMTVKTEGWGNKHQVYLTPLGLINAALSAATGNKVAVEFDEDNKIKFVME